MKPRKLELGDRNIIGKRVTEARLTQGMKQVELLAKNAACRDRYQRTRVVPAGRPETACIRY